MHIKLLVACFRYEKAHQIIQDDRNWRYPDNPNRRRGPQHNPPHNKCDNTGEVMSSAVITPTPKQDKPTMTDSADSCKKGRCNDGQQDAKWRKHLREEGKCFQCAGTDHIQRNCLQRQSTGRDDPSTRRPLSTSMLSDLPHQTRCALRQHRKAPNSDSLLLGLCARKHQNYGWQNDRFSSFECFSVVCCHSPRSQQRS